MNDPLTASHVSKQYIGSAICILLCSIFLCFVFCVLYVGQGVYDFRPCDKIVDWAIDRGMEVKGHTLCWHVTTPEFAEDMSASRLREALYRRDRETEREGQTHRQADRRTIWDKKLRQT